MKLHSDKTLFRQAVQFTADQMKIPAIYIEKDYWVTFALHTIFKHAIGKDSVFKGGTSLPPGQYNYTGCGWSIDRSRFTHFNSASIV